MIFKLFLIENDPKTFGKAMSSQNAYFWKEAINNKIDSIMSDNTWFLTDLSFGCNTIGCKGIFKKKLRTDGSIEKFEARLVAKYFKQRECIDFFDTYSSDTKITTIIVLLLWMLFINQKFTKQMLKLLF